MKVGDLVRHLRRVAPMIGVVVEPPVELALDVRCRYTATKAGILWPDGDGGVCYHSTAWLEVICESR